MKHASPSTLSTIAPLLDAIRQLPGLREKKPGTFYLKGSAFLHFHEDPAGLFADVKLDGLSFFRFPINGKKDEAAFLSAVRRAF